MKRLGGLVGVMVLLMAGIASAVVVDFVGGEATLWDGSKVYPTDTGGYYGDVDYYVEDGIMIDFVGGYGIIGDYYSIGAGGPVNNSVIHAHWDSLGSIVFSKVDGSTMDLNYMDLTSNTEIGGGQSTGNERSYVTASSGGSMLLPSSDWGIDYDYWGDVGDGIQRLWMADDFDGITSFTVTSQNAYCFGLDNFYIDEPAPPGVPDAAGTLLLLGLGISGLAYLKRR